MPTPSPLTRHLGQAERTLQAPLQAQLARPGLSEATALVEAMEGRGLIAPAEGGPAITAARVRRANEATFRDMAVTSPLLVEAAASPYGRSPRSSGWGAP